MSRTLTAADRSALIRLASTMEKGSEERRAILHGLQKSAGAPRILYPVVEAVFDALGAGAVTAGHYSLLAKALVSDLADWPDGDFMVDLDEGNIDVQKYGDHEGAWEVSYRDNPAAYGFSWGSGPLITDEVDVTISDVPIKVVAHWEEHKSLLDMVKPGGGAFIDALTKLARKGLFNPDLRGKIPYVVVARVLTSHWRLLVPIVKSGMEKALKGFDRRMTPALAGEILELPLESTFDDMSVSNVGLDAISHGFEGVDVSSTVKDVRLDRPGKLVVSVATIFDNIENKIELDGEWEEDYNEPEPDDGGDYW